MTGISRPTDNVQELSINDVTIILMFITILDHPLVTTVEHLKDSYLTKCNSSYVSLFVMKLSCLKCSKKFWTVENCPCGYSTALLYSWGENQSCTQTGSIQVIWTGKPYHWGVMLKADSKLKSTINVKFKRLTYGIVVHKHLVQILPSV